MAKSRRRRKKPSQAPKGQRWTPPAAVAESKPKRRWWRFVAAAGAAVAAGATYLVTFTDAGDLLTRLVGKPVIEATGDQETAPFELRFAISNRSDLFEMKNVKVECLVEKVQLEHGNSIVGARVIDSKASYKLGPKKKLYYRCPLVNAELYVIQAQMKIAVTYDMIGGRRSTTSETFNWSSANGSWLEGALVN